MAAHPHTCLPALYACLPCFLCSCRSGTWITHSVANVLGATLRVHRSAPRWWRAATAWPFRLFTGMLRKHLGRWGLRRELEQGGARQLGTALAATADE